MKVLAIIQARMTSQRLPGKVLADLNGNPVLKNIVDRVSRAKRVEKVVVATSEEHEDDVIAALGAEMNITVFRGDLKNVLKRFYLCACQYSPKMIVRLTGDNALIDPQIIDEAIACFETEQVDYLRYKQGLPIGMCIEVFTFDALKKAYYEASDPECLEHVTPYIYRNPRLFKALFYKDKSDTEDYSTLRFTMDTPEDYCFVKQIYSFFGGNAFSYQDILFALKKHKDWLLINQSVKQNEVMYKGE